jgi:hypothetical protein
MPRFAYAVGIWRTANPEPDLENMFCATPFGDSLRINEGKTNEKNPRPVVDPRCRD